MFQKPRHKETEATDFRFSILIFGELAPIPGAHDWTLGFYIIGQLLNKLRNLFLQYWQIGSLLSCIRMTLREGSHLYALCIRLYDAGGLCP